MLNIQHLAFSFENYQVLNDLSLTLAKGKIGTLIGPSGSGKTTLFRLLTGTLPLQKGTFSIGTTKPSQTNNQIAYMRQEELLLPWRTVLSNLLLVGELGKRRNDRQELEEKARLYLRDVGLEGWEHAYPDQLSGGMRQRVSLARALLEQRPVLLLDEPFSSLDVGLREQMHTLLRSLRDKHNITMLMVTHDFRDALSLSDQIFLISNGSITQQWQIPSDIHNEPLLFQQLYQEMFSAIKK